MKNRDDAQDPDVAEFLELVRREGVHAVSHWKRPNTDGRFNDRIASEKFKDEIDDYMELSERAIEQIGQE